MQPFQFILQKRVRKNSFFRFLITFPALLGAIGVISSRTCDAQVVQLPSTRVFQSNTSVMVPDQGTVVMGGVGRGYQSTVNRGGFPFGNSGFASGYQYSQLSVTASIIDLEELDLAIRGGLAAPTGRAAASSIQPMGPYAGPPRTSRALPSRDPGPPKGAWQQLLASGAGTLALPPAAESGNEAAYYLEMARQAKNDMHFAAARVYYQMALESLPPNALNVVKEQLNKPADDSDTAKSSAAGQSKSIGSNATGRVAF